MMKLVYPEEGIYTYCKADSNTSYNSLKNAVSYTNNFEIPSDFTYNSYLYNLGSTLYKYQNEISSLDAVLNTIDSDYESLAERLSTEANKLSVTKIKTRDRMIK